MKKNFYLLGLFTLVCLLIIGCTNENESEYVADKDDFKNAFFKSDRYQIQIDKDKLVISGNNYPGKKYSFDYIFFPDGDEASGGAVFMEYDNTKVTTKGANYYISADGISFTLKKFQNHIVLDEEGNEFIRTQIKLD